MPMPDQPDPQQTGEDQQVNELMALLSGAGGGSSLPDDILGGFYGGTQVRPQTPAQADAYASVFDRPSATSQQPGYREGDPEQILSSMNTEELAAFQDALVANGIVTEVWPGRIDDNTLSGMTTLMEVGNRHGSEWGSVLSGLEEAGGLADARGQSDAEFQPQARLKMDPAQAEELVRQTFESQLGRQPDDYELQQLANRLQGYDQLEYEREQELRQLESEQEPGDEAPVVEGVDPVSRFTSKFREMYQGEIDFRDRRDDTAEVGNTVQAAVDLTSQAAGGGV